MTDIDPNADLKQHIATPEIIALGRRVDVSRKTKKRRERFVMVPWTWIERLKSTRQATTFKVAHHVLYEHWRNGGKPFTLSNSAVGGVSRWQKWRALNELERLKLITVERRKRKTPLIMCAGAAC
jgi:hypothetical protein